MNWFNIVLLAVPVLYILNGVRRGMIRTAFSLLSIVLTLVLGYLFTPYISEFLKEETPIYSSIQTGFEEKLTEAAKSRLEETAGQEEQEAFIKSLPLPESMQKVLIQHNNTEGYQELVAETFGEYLSNSAAQLAVGAVSLILTFLLVGIFLRLLSGLLEGIFSLPVLSLLNRAGGAVLGLMQGVFFVWVIFLVLTLFWDTGWSQTAVAMIGENEITTYLYNHNPLTGLVFGAGGF